MKFIKRSQIVQQDKQKKHIGNKKQAKLISRKHNHVLITWEEKPEIYAQIH